MIYMDGESGVRNSKLFQKYFTENKITVHYSRGIQFFAERFIGTFKSMSDNASSQVKTGRSSSTLYDFPIITS